jgi:putative endonuclease
LHWVYILLCSNGNYYTGYTTDLKRRYAEHLAGSPKCTYTRSFKPKALVQSWKVPGDKSKALKIECFIKKLSRQAKLELIAKPKILRLHFDLKAPSKARLKPTSKSKKARAKTTKAL